MASINQFQIWAQMLNCTRIEIASIWIRTLYNMKIRKMVMSITWHLLPLLLLTPFIVAFVRLPHHYLSVHMMDVSRSEPALWCVQSEIDHNATVEVKKSRTNKHTQCVEWKKCNVFTFGENCNGNNRCSIDAMATPQIHIRNGNCKRNCNRALTCFLFLSPSLYFHHSRIMRWMKRMYFCHKFSIFIKMVANTFENIPADIEVDASHTHTHNAQCTHLQAIRCVYVPNTRLN